MRSGRSLLSRWLLGTTRLCSRASLPLTKGALAAVLAMGTTHPAHSEQSQNPFTPEYPSAPGQNTGRTLQDPGQGRDPGQDAMLRRALSAAAKKRSVERQNKLTADSGKIVELARQLSDSAQTDIRSSPASEMAKKAEEIGKLARSVRELMKAD